MDIRVFISYHRADHSFRKKTENILKSHNVYYYVVPEDMNFNGKSAESIKTFLCEELKQCDVLLCLIGKDTYSRPHVDHEIHTALKGNVGDRLGIIGVHLPTRNDHLQSPDLNTFPVKLCDNKDYVVWTEWNSLNNDILELVQIAYERSKDKHCQTNHSNTCMELRKKIYYDN